MSSDSSVSSNSKVSQFGLYRTIDARTEEFLRLSKKRQIRQGCACAAASTAITVTVVIVVFFIYEFSLNSDLTLATSFKSNWLNLMNDTAADSSFEPKFNKANIDRATLKLLPLLIKAIKKNAYLEKLLEDHSSSSPAYDDKETPEDAFEEKRFSKNWFKMPTTKLYAIEYKTSPVVFYKNPTENIEYYTKIRKIRDYQRVFNYVDKMISEKVYIRSTKPMLKGETHTDIPQLHKKFPVKKKLEKNQMHSQIKSQTQMISPTPFEKISPKPNFHCKCPKKFSEMLHKILASIQKLLPETSLRETKLSDNSYNHTTPALSMSLFNPNTFNKFPDLSLKSQIFTPTKARLSDDSHLNFKVDQVTEPDMYVTNNINNPLISPDVEQSTEINRIILLTNRSSNSQVIQPIQFINKYKSIVHRKQLLRNNIPKTTEAFYEPIFDGIEYDDYHAATKIPIKSTKHNNVINFIKTKLNYLGNNELQKKSSIKKFKKTNEHQSLTTHLYETLNKNNDPNMTVNNDTIILLKRKPTYPKNIKMLVKPNNDNKKYSYTTTKKRFVQTKSTTNNQTESSISIELATSGESFLDANNRISKVYDLITPSPASTVTPRATFYKSIDVKNVYHLIKNETPTLTERPMQHPKSTKTMLFNLTSTSTTAQKQPFPKYNQDNKKNSNAAWHYVKSNDKLTLNDSLKSKAILSSSTYYNLKTENKYSTLATALHKSDLLKGAELLEDDVEFTTGEISEITKPPDPTIDKPENNIVTKLDDYNLAWEDLNSENTPTLQPIMPEPKSLYLELHRNDNNHQEQLNDDYNINSNFYDLVL